MTATWAVLTAAGLCPVALLGVLVALDTLLESLPPAEPPTGPLPVLARSGDTLLDLHPVGWHGPE